MNGKVLVVCCADAAKTALGNEPVDAGDGKVKTWAGLGKKRRFKCWPGVGFCSVGIQVHLASSFRCGGMGGKHGKCTAHPQCKYLLKDLLE